MLLKIIRSGQMNNKVPFTLRIDKDMLKEVRARAIEEECSISDWICEAIEMMLTYGIQGSLGNEERL